MSTRIDDIPYSTPGARTLLADLYLPDESEGTRPLPVILWLHAGGWIAGNRRRAPDLARHFAERGFAMASIDYRLSREALFPAALEDVLSAVKWLRKSGPDYGLDPDRIALWGASAGGHLAALAALSSPELGVKAVAAVYPPTDFLQMPDSVKRYEDRFLGAPVHTVPDLVRRANPCTYAYAGAPPFLLLHGLADVEVPPNQSEFLYEALRGHNNEVTLSVVDELTHGFLEQDDFENGPPPRHRIRISRPNEAEHAGEADPFTYATFEAFFRRHLCAA